MFIRTERLMLRPTFPEDWREVFAGICDEGVVRMLARAPWPYTPRDAQDFCKLRPKPGDWRFGIALPGEDGAPLIGQIGLGPFEAGGGRELGYWIGRKWHGHGYATEAARAVLETARAMGIERVEAGHFLDNPASGRVLRKCGFVETGHIRPTACAGRCGTMVPARRYVCDLTQPATSVAA